jgi:hypothetical protein
MAGWSGRPIFADDAWGAMHRHTDGIPRRVNQLANRLMLFAAVEGTDRIDAAAVEAVVADIAAERPDVRAAFAERVLPLRSVAPAPRPAPEAEYEAPPAPQSSPVADLALERRVAALEARVVEQEQALRRVLSLLVDWIENEEPGARSNAA